MTKDELETKINQGCTLEQLAVFYSKAESTIKYWLNKYSLKIKSGPYRRTWSDDLLRESVKGSISLKQVITKNLRKCFTEFVVTTKSMSYKNYLGRFKSVLLPACRQAGAN